MEIGGMCWYLPCIIEDQFPWSAPDVGDLCIFGSQTLALPKQAAFTLSVSGRIL